MYFLIIYKNANHTPCFAEVSLPVLQRFHSLSCRDFTPYLADFSIFRVVIQRKQKPEKLSPAWLEN